MDDTDGNGRGSGGKHDAAAVGDGDSIPTYASIIDSAEDVEAPENVTAGEGEGDGGNHRANDDRGSGPDNGIKQREADVMVDHGNGNVSETRLYEYQHPVINQYLQSNTTGPDGKNISEGKKFPTLEAWYDVVNDYEFRTRCPIILKNSHRNKHFTFACHLKTCNFKILLSYCGNNSDGPRSQTASTLNSPRLGGHDDEVDDDAVTAAIAAAVAAVHDPKPAQEGEEEHADQDTVDNENDRQNHDKHKESPGLSSSHNTPTTTSAAVHSRNNEQSVLEGPFMVTKIEHYHNHPLESNLSLGRFVLAKIPRILQYDLNFDQILEGLCNEEDNTISKFRVSQYVEESGILEILRERYGLTDADLDKKLRSQIARRVTTYKARFVLKKKRNGEYGNPAVRDANKLAQEEEEKEVSDSSRTKATKPSNRRYARASALMADAQAAAQAAMGDSNALKRSLHQMIQDEIGGTNADEDDTSSIENGNKKKNLMRLSNSLSNDDAGLVSLEDNPDDKLPHDVAEQLRLLSSHFKEVESAHGANNGGSTNNGNTDNSNGNTSQDAEHDNASALEASIKVDIKDEIPDENIQPELRGQ